MAKKKTNKAASQPKGNSKSPVAENSEPTIETLPEQEVLEQELFETQLEQPVETETQDSPTNVQSEETKSTETERDYEIFFELGEDDEEEGISVEITSIEEATTTEQPLKEEETPITEQPAIEEPSTEASAKKAKKNKLGNAETTKLAGCTYHFFRKYFKKKFDNEGIKVRFIKAELGYNGHLEVAQTDRDKAVSLLLILKTENADVKNLFWFI
jgi:hypothetical protein